MAEGWALEWIRNQKEQLDDKLESVPENGEEIKQNYSMDKKHLDVTGSKEFITFGENPSDIERKISIIKNVVVASVALDSSAVFTTKSIDSSSELLTKKRKSVKSKAVKAMAKDGVDISAHIPKSIDEIFHNCVVNQSTEETQSRMNDVLNGNVANSDEDGKIDKLIVLCSCGDDVKNNLIRRSKSVDEWDIDPPTASAKSGEGDAAFRRVSLEIRRKVDILMEELFHSTL